MTVLEAGAIAKTAVTTLAMMAVQGTVLALLALIVVRAGRLRPAWQAAIWLVVLLKFVLPWGPAMPWSLSDLFASFHATTPAGAPLVVTSPGAIAAPPPLGPALGWLVLAAAWAAIAVALFARAVIRHRRIMAAARRAPAAPATVRAEVVELAVAMRVRPPRVAVGPAATGPHVIGVVRPIIVVPPALVADRALLRAAVVHELAHIRRRDAAARWLQVIATSVLFWWPVVRIVVRRLDVAREAACDAWAMSMVDVAPSVYARLLVRMAALRTVEADALASPRSLDVRVAAVLGPRARPQLGAVHGALLVGWIALALGGARSASAAGDAVPCDYTPAMAEALRQAHPEADLDGDGYLSRDEACRLEADVRRRAVAPIVGAGRLRLEARAPFDRVLPVCCNCTAGDGQLPATGDAPASPGDTCQRSEGVDR